MLFFVARALVMLALIAGSVASCLMFLKTQDPIFAGSEILTMCAALFLASRGR